MQKIVILCGEKEVNPVWVSMLQLLFPQCEIEIKPKENAFTTSSIPMTATTESTTKYKGTGK